MRTLTTYKRPSLADMLAAAPTIQHLAAYRAEMGQLHQAGKLAPAEKTRARWIDALWLRVAELMAVAPTIEEVEAINTTALPWPKPFGVGDVIAAIYTRRVAALSATAAAPDAQPVEVSP